MWRSPNRPFVIGATFLIGLLLCSCAGPSNPTASKADQTGYSWPASFCQVVKQVMGTDATDVVDSPRGTTSGNGAEAAIAQLGRDIDTSLKQAPTAQLRRELTQYQTTVTTAQGTGRVVAALSHFDLLAGSQVRSCGIRPIQG